MKAAQTRGLLAALGVAVLVLLGLFLTMDTFYQFTENAAQDYFVQIDNSEAREITPRDGMSYRYTLRAFTAEGREKEISFDTAKVLRDGAFACLRVAPVRGVISWAEVPYEELPPAVQKSYEK